MNKKITISVLLDFYGKLLSEKQFLIMDYYYNDDLSLREISELVGITRQGVHDTIKRSDAFLEELEEKLGLYKKWQSIQHDLDCVERTLQNILPKNADKQDNSRVSEHCNKAIGMIETIKNKF